MPYWYGTVRYGTVRYGIVLYCTSHYGTVRYRYRTARYTILGTLLNHVRCITVVKYIRFDSFWCIIDPSRFILMHQWCMNASTVHKCASMSPASLMHRLYSPHQWCIDYVAERSLMYRLFAPPPSPHQWCIEYPTPASTMHRLFAPMHKWCIDYRCPRINDVSIIGPPH